MWVLAHNKLPTMENLKRKGFKIPKKCKLFYREEEIMDNLFKYCQLKQEHFNLIKKEIHFIWVEPTTLKYSILQ